MCFGKLHDVWVYYSSGTAHAHAHVRTLVLQLPSCNTAHLHAHPYVPTSAHQQPATPNVAPLLCQASSTLTHIGMTVSMPAMSHCD